MGWSKSPKSFTKEVKDSHRLLCQKLALDIDRRLVLKTPVDTGRARANWLASVGQPSSEVSGREDPTGAAAISQAANEITRAQFFPVIYLNNNLPYIGALNAGSSQQAPAGFVEASINEAVRAVK